MYVIGMNPYQGLVSKADFKRGKMPTPGNRGAVAVNGDTREFVAVKLAAATWINGTVVRIDASTGNVTAAVTAPSTLLNDRMGILCFASATATQTVAGTSYGWAQIYGQAMARVQAVATISVPGIQMVLASVAGQLRVAAAGLASAQADIEGITALGTGSADSLLAVFLQYPRLTGPHDLNLA